MGVEKNWGFEPRKKPLLLLSIESWLINRDPYDGLAKIPVITGSGSIIPHIQKIARFFFIAHFSSRVAKGCWLVLVNIFPENKNANWWVLSNPFQEFLHNHHQENVPIEFLNSNLQRRHTRTPPHKLFGLKNLKTNHHPKRWRNPATWNLLGAWCLGAVTVPAWGKLESLGSW